MNAQALMLPLMLVFVNCFTAPGFEHFQNFIVAHAALMGFKHCVTEVMRLTGVHHQMHWTTPYKFLSRARWSCRAVSQCLLDLIAEKLNLFEELIICIDDTLVKKSGKKFFGLGYYPDPTDKNPGAHKRRVLGHCWVVMTVLWEKRGRWFAFPITALLFVPQAVCAAGFQFKTKIELAALMIKRLRWPARRLLLVVDNLYAKQKLAWIEIEAEPWWSPAGPPSPNPAPTRILQGAPNFLQFAFRPQTQRNYAAEKGGLMFIGENRCQKF